VRAAVAAPGARRGREWCLLCSLLGCEAEPPRRCDRARDHHPALRGPPPPSRSSERQCFMVGPDCCAVGPCRCTEGHAYATCDTCRKLRCPSQLVVELSYSTVWPNNCTMGSMGATWSPCKRIRCPCLLHHVDTRQPRHQFRSRWQQANDVCRARCCSLLSCYSMSVEAGPWIWHRWTWIQFFKPGDAFILSIA
jgi:hypothetical protein